MQRKLIVLATLIVILSLVIMPVAAESCSTAISHPTGTVVTLDDDRVDFFTQNYRVEIRPEDHMVVFYDDYAIVGEMLSAESIPSGLLAYILYPGTDQFDLVYCEQDSQVMRPFMVAYQDTAIAPWLMSLPPDMLGMTPAFITGNRVGWVQRLSDVSVYWQITNNGIVQVDYWSSSEPSFWEEILEIKPDGDPEWGVIEIDGGYSMFVSDNRPVPTGFNAD